MSEAGAAILSKRSNHLRRRVERQLRRAHRADSFDDDADANGSIIQHPTDKYSSGDEEEEARLEAEAQRADDERRAKFQAATAAAAASSRPALPAARPGVPLTGAQVRAQCESELQQLACSTREAEAKLRNLDQKLKQMGQWKTKAMNSQPFNPYDILNPNALMLTELTKLRLYRRLITSSVARSWLRGFRARKQVRHLHAQCQRIVQKYLEAKSGVDGGQQQQQHQQNEFSHTRRSDAAEEKESDAYSIGPPATATSAYNFSPSASLAHFPSYPASTVSGLQHPSSLPQLFSSPSPPALGSLTDAPASSEFGGGGLNILSSTRALGDPQGKISLQAELAEWRKQSMNVLKYGSRMGKSHASSTAGGGDHHHHAAHSSTDGAHSLRGSTQELMLCLSDLGPSLRCMVEDLLSARAAAQTSLRSFEDRNTQLEQELHAEENRMHALEFDEKQLTQYLSLSLGEVASLFTEAKSLRSLAEQHETYTARLRKAVEQIKTNRERRAIEKRKSERLYAHLAAQAQASSASSGSGGAPHLSQKQGSTGGQGISSHLLAQAVESRRLQEESQRNALLREVIEAQEVAMRNAARARTSTQTAAAGAASSSSSSSTAKKKRPPPSFPLNLAGVEELEKLLDVSLPTPHLQAFLERRRAQVAKAMGKKGWDMSSSSVDVTSAAGGESVGSPRAHSRTASRPGSPSKGLLRGKSLSPNRSSSSRPSSAVPQLASSSQVSSPTASSSRPSSAVPQPHPSFALALPLHHASSALSGQQASSSLEERLEMHRATAMHTSGHSAVASPAPTTQRSIADVLARMPLAAYPPPPVVQPLRAPPLRLPTSSTASDHAAPRPFIPVATELRGGLSSSVREREINRLAQSPYMRSAVLTPQQELAAATAGGDSAAATASSAIPASARGSRPLKSPLDQGGRTSSGAPPMTARLPSSARAIAHQKLAQQKVRVEKQLYDKTLFERP